MHQKPRIKDKLKAYKALNLSISFRTESILIITLLIVFLLVGLATASRLHTVWLDEVMFTDPAANLYLGNGFTSSAWYAQTKDEFWAGNSPLYTVLIYLWIQIFEFSIVAVRSLNYVLIAISGLILWLSVIRLNLVTTAWSRISLIALFISSSGITYNYITGRYDCIGISLYTAALLTYSIKNNRFRYFVLAIIGIFLPIAGLHLLVYGVTLAILLKIYNNKLNFKEFIAVGTGCCIGMSFLYVLYKINGVWGGFIKSISAHTIHKSQLNVTSLSRLINLFNKSEYLCAGCLKDKSFQIVFILGLIVLIYQVLTNNLKSNSLLSFGLIVSICVPVIMCFLGKYPLYYSWMSFIPLSICICSSLAEILKSNRHSIIALVILILIGVSCLGFPIIVAKAVVNWEAMNYAKVENFIEMTIREDDVAYSDYSAFYAIKKRTASVIFPFYISQMTLQEKEKISVLIIDSRRNDPWNPKFSEVIRLLKGNWYYTGYSLDTKKYNLKVFRRKNESDGIKRI